MAGVKRFTDLEAWRLASALSDLVHQLTESGPASLHVRFKTQIREAAASVESNIAEGWGRYYPKENAQFVRWARGSLTEVQSHLLYAQRQRLFTEEDFKTAWAASESAIRTTTRYLRYLESCNNKRPANSPNPRNR
jgi:four helix bundle protein